MSEYEAKANPKGGWNIKKIKEENPKPPKKMSYEYKLFILCQRSHDKDPDTFKRMMREMVEEHERELSQAEDNMRKRCVEALSKAYDDVIDKTNDYTFVLAQREGIQRFDKSGVRGSPSPEEGLTIKQYINKYFDDRIKIAGKDEELAYKKLKMVKDCFSIPDQATQNINNLDKE